jgi:hypothetical protein
MPNELQNGGADNSFDLDQWEKEADAITDPAARSLFQKGVDLVKGFVSKADKTKSANASEEEDKSKKSKKDDEDEEGTGDGDATPLPADTTEGDGDGDGEVDGDEGDGDGDGEPDDDEELSDEAPPPRNIKKGHDLDENDVDSLLADDLDLSDDDFLPQEAINVTELVKSVELHLVQSQEREGRLEAALGEALKANAQIMEQNATLLKSFDLFNGEMTEIKKSVGEQLELLQEEVTLNKAFGDKIETLSMTPHPFGTPRGKGKGEHLLSKGVDENFEPPSNGGGSGSMGGLNFKRRHGLTDGQFVTGLGAYVRDNPHNDLGLSSDTLMKAVALAPEERGEQMYKAACIGLGIGFVAENE